MITKPLSNLQLFATAVAVSVLIYWSTRENNEGGNELEVDRAAYEALIGNTPLVRLNRLSAILRRSIFVKMESLNPGGTGKDRAALGMILEAEKQGCLPPPNLTPSPIKFRESNDGGHSILAAAIVDAMQRSLTGGLVVEGTSGSTGIALASLCASRGHACLVVLPDDQASEKQSILKALGATVHVVPNAAISNPNHYVNIARRAALTANKMGAKAVFIDQFENVANFETHFTQTGPEIYKQCPEVSAFVMSSGTGGTIAGVGQYLKERKNTINVVLVDPPGSALYNKIQHNVAFHSEQREQSLKRHRYDTLAEGVGLDRVTQNLKLGINSIDSAIQVSDQEAVDMAWWLQANEGLWVGSSSAMNVVGAVRTALEMQPSSTIVTMICDSGQRHITRFWNRDFVISWGLKWPGDGEKRNPACLASVDGRS